MQEIVSSRYEECDEDIEACVSVPIIRDLPYERRFNIKLFSQFDLFNLKLLHMDRCKYITANGFFTINYSTMFSVKKSYNFYSISYTAQFQRYFRCLRRV